MTPYKCECCDAVYATAKPFRGECVRDRCRLRKVLP